MLKPDDPLNLVLDQIRDETGSDDWQDRARAVLKTACAMTDDWIPSDQHWYVWVQEQFDALYAEFEIKPGGEGKTK